MSDERNKMTPQELDELASAYIDGKGTAEEAALVESSPRLQALVEELRTVRDLVATPVAPPSDEVRDEMIFRALAHRAPVVSLEKARRRLRSMPPQAKVVLAAAVVAAIAMMGVTVFERANRDGGDTFASDDDSAAAPEMAGATVMDAPASALEPESEEPVEEAMMDFSASASDAAGKVAAPPDSGEAMMAREPAPALEGPESPEEEFVADGGPMEAPAEDSVEPEPAAAAETEVVSTSGEALSWYETEADLVAHVAVLAYEELAEASGTNRDDEAPPVDLMGCPLFRDEEIDLLTRFDAIVEGTEAQVSVYLDDGELRFTQTTPPPECELLNSHIFTNWP